MRPIYDVGHSALIIVVHQLQCTSVCPRQQLGTCVVAEFVFSSDWSILWVRTYKSHAELGKRSPVMSKWQPAARMWPV